MRLQLTVKIKTIFQEQEVNNAGIALRVSAAIVVSRLMHFKRGSLHGGAQWRRAECGGRVPQPWIQYTHEEIKKPEGQRSARPEHRERRTSAPSAELGPPDKRGEIPLDVFSFSCL